MLFAGENEYAQSLESLERQSFRQWDLVRYENLPNKQAHDQLYRTFMERAASYRFFLKLDADTVLRDENSLEQLMLLLDVPERGTLIIDAHDWISDFLIPAGMQAYSNRVRWPVNPDLLMVDHSPVFRVMAIATICRRLRSRCIVPIRRRTRPSGTESIVL
jgi:hypothetical protein